MLIINPALREAQLANQISCHPPAGCPKQAARIEAHTMTYTIVVLRPVVVHNPLAEIEDLFLFWAAQLTRQMILEGSGACGRI
jgi:hypothetical protein